MATSLFTLKRIKVWCCCVFGIMLGWSSKFTIWRWSKWKPWSTSQWPRGRRSTCYIACFMFFMIFFFIYVTLSQHCFQMCYTSLGNVPLILSTTSFQSFEAIGCLRHSQHFSSQRLVIIYKFSSVHNLLWTYNLWTTLGTPKLTFTLKPNH